jgi:DnaJ-class molecular chaperone
MSGSRPIPAQGAGEASALTVTCRQCGGDGEQISDRNNNGVWRDVIPCPACKGNGKVAGYYCTSCGQHITDDMPCGCGART